MVLTYNRKDLLVRCLAALEQQTRRCDRVIVIDNASTDGTFDMLANARSDGVEVHALPRNVGAAGGYNIGMRLAYQTGADFVWTMDDDVIPERDALERLLSSADYLLARSIPCPFIVSTARSTEGLVTNVPDIDKRRNAIAYENWPAFLEQRIAPVTRATFVSLLLPRATLQKHGLPLAAMFIWGEDSEFTLRVTRDCAGYMVGDSRVTHVREVSGTLDIRTENNPARIGYHFHLKRNDVYLKRRYEGTRSLVRHLIRQLLLALRLLSAGHRTKARIVLLGSISGLSFNPAIEPVDAPFNRNAIRTIAPAMTMQAAD